MKTKTIALALALTLAAPTFAETVAYAQGSSAEMKLHFQRGVKMYSEEDFRGAAVEFKRAYEVSNNYAVLYNLGQAYFQLRDYANALKSFESYLSSGGAQVTAQRKADVERDIEDLRGRVAKLTVESSLTGASVSIDDVPVGKIPLPGPITVSAGRRSVTLTKDGIAPVTKSVELAGGDKTTVTLEPPAPVAVSTPPPAPPKQEQPPEKSVSALVFVGYGVAVVGVAVGATFGILALGTKSDLNADCPNGGTDCFKSASSKGSTLSTQATLSTIGFGVGIAGAIVGTIFLVTGGSSSSTKAQTTPKVSPWFAGTSGGLVGTF